MIVALYDKKILTKQIVNKSSLIEPFIRFFYNRAFFYSSDEVLHIVKAEMQIYFSVPKYFNR